MDESDLETLILEQKFKIGESQIRLNDSTNSFNAKKYFSAAVNKF